MPEFGICSRALIENIIPFYKVLRKTGNTLPNLSIYLVIDDFKISPAPNNIVYISLRAAIF